MPYMITNISHDCVTSVLRTRVKLPWWRRQQIPQKRW